MSRWPALLLFLSMPPGRSQHDKITREAARRAGWPRGSTRHLLRAVRRPDWEDFGLRPTLRRLRRVDALRPYRPEHHADRLKGQPDVDAFVRTGHYIRRRLVAAKAASRAGMGEVALRHVGRGLHALQDAYSHSSFVDLGARQQQRFLRSLLAGGPPPTGLHVARFQPGAPDPGGGRRGHDRLAKDAPGINKEARAPLDHGTKFEAARDGAVEASAQVLQQFLHLAAPARPRRRLRALLGTAALGLALLAHRGRRRR